jgi:hypothetical protein
MVNNLVKKYVSPLRTNVCLNSCTCSWEIEASYKVDAEVRYLSKAVLIWADVSATAGLEDH